MTLKLNDTVQFSKDLENKYVVYGIDPISQRIWLCIDRDEWQKQPLPRHQTERRQDEIPRNTYQPRCL